MSALLLALAAATAPLAPVGKWIVNYGENECTMERRFGSADRPVSFGFKPEPTREAGDMVLIFPDRGTGHVARGKGKVTLDGGEPMAVRWASGPLPGGGHGVRLSADKPFWDAFPSARTISFDVGEPQPITASLGDMTGVLGAIRTCGDDLIRHWGGDPSGLIRDADYEAIARFFGPDAYPPEAQRANLQGRVRTLTDIDRKGQPIACRVVDTSGAASLDAATCRIVMHNVRLPADAAAPEKRDLYLAIRWVLPDF